MNGHDESPTAAPTAGGLCARDVLAPRIVEDIERQGYFLTHIPAFPPQELIDLRWAGQMAGRMLGQHTRTYASPVGAQEPGKVTVVVALTEVHSPEDVQRMRQVRAVIERSLQCA